MEYSGEVLWFNPKPGWGYGFIGWSIDGQKQKDMFVHYSDIICEGFRTLKKGQKVQFEIGENKHGDPKAVNVIIVDSKST